jgi:O-antigen/teichoic acid export membrane protein
MIGEPDPQPLEGRRGGRASAPIMMRTAGALLSVRGLTWLTGTAALLVVPRFLGSENFGLLAFATAVASIVGLLATFGTNAPVARSVARDPDSSPSIVAQAVVIRLVLWGALTAPLLVGWAIFAGTGLPFTLLAIACTGVPLSLTFNVMWHGLLGHNSLGRLALAVSINAALMAAPQILVVVLGFGAVGVALSVLAIQFLNAAVAVGVYVRSFGGPVTLSRQGTRRLVVEGAPFFGWEAALFAYRRIDVLMLGALARASSIGFYALGMRVASIPFFISDIVRPAVFPTLSATAHEDPGHYRTVLTYAFRSTVILILPMAVGLALVSTTLVPLIAGSGFDKAIAVTVVASLTLPITAIDTLLGSALGARDRQRSWMFASWGAVPVNAAMNVSAILLADAWWSNPAVGAATATAITELFLTFWAWRLVGDTIDRRIASVTTSKALAACAVMAIAVLAVRPLGLLVMVPTGAAVYCGLAMALRLVTVAELRQVRAALLPQRGASEAQVA